ncbi:MAG: C10 family peptidase, partial [Muribaculaceae bacterium]|nr:C10 family peptidase [Muribaculaceae bacterium]
MKIKAIAIMLALPLAGIAKNIGLTEAQSIAAKFFNESGIHVAESGVVVPKTSVTPIATMSPAYYVFNAGSPDGGFVIIAADDRLGQVLGYSDTGEFSLDGAPDGLKGLMSMYEVYAAALAEADAPAGRSSAESTGTPIVNPLLDAVKWGQDAPFNTLCPTYNTTSGTAHYYVGCVATAATQIMRYHGYPDKGIGEKSYTFNGMTLSANFGDTNYDWANMPAAVPDKATDAQTTAYSTLAYHFGVAVDMQYEQGGSGAYDHMVAPALRKYFGYDSGARMYLREHFTTSEWLSMIKSELDAKRPVFYGATSDNGSGGHAFVLDGYDSNDYFHINWGWYGRSNGYFMINHLNPDDLGEGGGYGGYNLQQDMVTGIQPPCEGVKPQPAIYGATRLRASYLGGTFLIMTGIENLDTDAFSGTVAAVITDNDDNIVRTLYSESVSVAGFANGRTGALPTYTMRSVPADVSGLEDGTYRLCLVYHSEEDSEWHILRHPVGLCRYLDLRVKNGILMEASDHIPSPDVELLAKLEAYPDLYAGCSTRIGFNLFNRTEDYRLSKITVRLTSVNDAENYVEISGSEDFYEASRK